MPLCNFRCQQLKKIGRDKASGRLIPDLPPIPVRFVKHLHDRSSGYSQLICITGLEIEFDESLLRHGMVCKGDAQAVKRRDSASADRESMGETEEKEEIERK